MARISNTKGIEQVGGSRYDLIMMAASRARSYSADNPPLAEHFNKRGMTALREIEEGLLDIEANKERMIGKYQTVTPATVVAEDN